MKNIRKFESFNQEKEYNEDYIVKTCKKYNIKKYTINEDLSIDVNGDVDLGGLMLTKIPLKFNRVEGHFSCGWNRLTSLENCPYYVGDYFSCGNNKLTSLKHSPKTIGRYYYFEFNNITNLEGFPENFEGAIWYRGNPVSEILNLFGENGDKLGSVIDEINQRNLINENREISKFMLSMILSNHDRDIPENLKFEHYNIY